MSADLEDLGIVDALAQLSFAVQNALTRRAAEQNLSIPQVRLLGVLRDRAPEMRQLAALLELDKSSVTGLVDRAQARGLVRREGSDSDRRVSRVALTSEGAAVVDEAVRAFETDIRGLVAGLSADDVAALSALASRVVREVTGNIS